MVDCELNGRRVSLATREPVSDEFRVVVDGVPVPMEMTRTETFTGNLGTHTREVEPAHPVAWIRIGGTARKPVVLGPRTIYIDFQLPMGHVYNTSIWRNESVQLTFPGDFSRVAVVFNESIDTST